MVVEYHSNKSGGYWWLKDEHWKKLEAAGWKVRWAATDPYYCKSATPDGRYMGALARSACKVSPSIDDAIAEWEAVTGMDAFAEGCSCCGRPHSFAEMWEEEEAT